MGLFGAYVYKDKKKQKWWLHSKTQGKTTFYYFSRSEEDAKQDMPGGYEVLFNERSGIPMLRKTVNRKDKQKPEKSGEGA